ncbi:MAG TPA: ribonuclease Z [Blastocatellia bacterium]|nr:ribonuclease Z [Blastocatellia bacterium]
MKVIPLGVSSGRPTLKRNVSAIAVVRDGEWLLFDCGEGTQSQIARAGLHQGKLAAVFVTHLHGDHFNGLPGFLSTMGLERRARQLTVIGPDGVREYLETLTRLKILYLNYPVEVRELGPPPRKAAAASSANVTAAALSISDVELTMVFDAPEYSVDAAHLDHRVFAAGYRVDEKPRPGRFDVEKARRLRIPEGPVFRRLQMGDEVELEDGRIVRPSDVLGPPRAGKSVAYCTDTRPCSGALTLARGVDLLIHEATFTGDLAAEAKEFGHSTAAEAASIARDAGARRLLITHFSSRYPDASRLLDEARSVFPDTHLAEELVEVGV